MSNYLIQGETLTNIANAIRTKTGKTDSIATENMASEISGISSGLTINGIIEQYKVQAGKTVNAGDFVEFVNAVSWGNGYPIAGEIASICAFELTNNRVLVVYSASNTYYPTAIILTLSGTTITAGTAKTINSKTVADQVNLNATQIESNKFLLAYTASSISEALIITVDESNVITVGTATTFESGGASEMHPIKLNESKVLIAYKSNSNSYGTAIVLSISGTTITAGTKLAFNSASTNWLDCVALTESKALVTFSNSGNSSYGTAVVLSISGTSITAGTKKVFESASILKSFAVALTESKVLVFYSDGGNSNYGTAVVLSVSGTSITAGSAKVTYSGACMGLDMAKLSENTALVVIKQSASYFNYAKGLAIVLSVSGTTVTAGTAVAFEPNSLDRVKWASVVAFSQNSALIVYGLIGYTNGGRYQGLSIDGTTITLNSEVKSETLVRASEGVINGVAKTGGSSGETVEVYVPTPKGYTVTLAYNSGYSNDTFGEASWIPLDYSVDGGATWNEWYTNDSSIEIPEVKTIMFRISEYGDSFKELLISKTLGTYDDTLSIEGTGTEASLNITENTTLYCYMLELNTLPHG